MIICVCNNVSEDELRRRIAEHKCKTLAEVREKCGACTNCGKCARDIRRILREKEPTEAPDE